MITPTVGRVLWFHPGLHDKISRNPDQPLAAHVAYVWSDTVVNLMVIDHDGSTHQRTSVRLLQDGEPTLVGEECCEWMPYQKSVAKGETAPNLHA